MYDKVKFFISTPKGQPDVWKYLDAAKEITDRETGEIRTSGSLGGMKVLSSSWGISVMGSLAKYYYQNNIQALDIHDTEEAIERLSDKLHLDISEAKVTELEFGANFIMKQPVEDYILRLGDISRMDRIATTKNTLYYRNKGERKVFTFYDKRAEAETKKMEIPPAIEQANLLRYEVRFKKNLSQLLKEPKIVVSTLYDNNFYNKMIGLYQQSYFSIEKVNKPVMKHSEIKNVTDAFELLIGKLLNESDQGSISDFIDELKRNNVFQDGKYYTRLKNKIKSVKAKASSERDELIKELDNKIHNMEAYR